MDSIVILIRHTSATNWVDGRDRWFILAHPHVCFGLQAVQWLGNGAV